MASALSREAITKREGMGCDVEGAWLIGFPEIDQKYAAHSNMRSPALSPMNVMNLIADPADLSSKDMPLREDVRLLGRILGETLREQEGEASFQMIENVRRAAIRFRRTRDDRDRMQLEQMLDALSPAETLLVVRAFSYFSQLSNIAEDLHHNRRHRTSLKAGSAPKDGSLALALKRLGERQVGKQTLQAFLDSALISPVLTAHPTEVQRKSILDCQLSISRLLSERDRMRCAASC
jgi:phosphoenolpyruvate carboxylase